MDSVYHILRKAPAIYLENISIEYEGLAQELVKSGRIRVDTGYYSNFVRFSDNKYKINFAFGYKELTREKLVTTTKEIITNYYQKYGVSISTKRLNEIIDIMAKKAKRLLLPPEDLLIRIARILVQSAHPIVIRWLLLDKVEVFITYSHNIGDTMNIANWRNNGSNSGMQSTDGQDAIIYVSCGGDPFAKNSEEHPQYGDGWAALARFQIIAAQEIGHYADIIRDPYGRQLSRHSANFSCNKAKDNVAKARLDDIQRCNYLLNDLMKHGMKELIDKETSLRFYDKQKITGLKIWWLKIVIFFQKMRLLKYTNKRNLIFPNMFYRREKYMGLMIKIMITDMLSHLSPVADVYQHSDPDVTEAIACAESLARIPQQSLKWGYVVTKETMHDLYKVYYKQVIPSLIDNYQLYTKQKFRRQKGDALGRQNILLRLWNRAVFFFKKGKIKFTEVRDI
ncbi:MAG: hypothetical protein DGJ47_000600 [Rickettsiaceae bacterium]